MNPKITFCILHYKRLQCLRKCVESIERYAGVPFKILILNQGYLDDEIKGFYSRLVRKGHTEIIYSDKNRGCPGGRAFLLPHAKTEYIMTLDDDIYLTENALSKVFGVFKQDSSIKVVAIPRLDARGNFQSTSGGRFNIRGKVMNKVLLPKKILDSGKDFEYVDFAAGGVQVVHKDLLNVFKWDPQYKAGFADLDKSMQVLRDGRYKQAVALNARAIHDHELNTGHYMLTRYDYKEFTRSYAKFSKKWNLRFPLIKHVRFRYVYLLPLLAYVKEIGRRVLKK